MTEPSPLHNAPSPSYDPRTIVTSYAFEVQDDLLGAELATPKRRLAALLVDLALASMLAALGGILVGFAVAFIFFRIATRRRVQHPLKRWARAAMAFTGAAVLFATVLAIIGGGWDAPFSDTEMTAAEKEAEQEAAQATVDSVAQALAREGINLAGLPGVNAAGPLGPLLTATTTPSDTASPRDRERTAALIHAYADALAAGDTTRTDSLQAPAANAVAGPQLQSLRTSLRRANDHIDALEDRNDALAERADNPSLWRVIRSTANDVGLRIGWLGVYFTIFLSWWNGQTPGKRLLGLRVARLDGRPLTLWASFERFGGYAAGLATGLFGFAQVYWDPNRQALHDRIAHTVVLRTRAS